MKQKIKIWGRSTSINVQKALIALDECGLEYDQTIIGRQHGGNKEPWFLKLNPNGMVPAIQDGELSLWESNAIIAYLCGKYSPGNLCPDDANQRALCDQWMLWQITSVYPHLQPLFMHKVRADEYTGGEALLKSAPVKMAKALDILEAELAGKDFIMGRSFTMADIPLGTILKRWYILMDEDDRHANVLAWQKRLNERQSFTDHTNFPLE